MPLFSKPTRDCATVMKRIFAFLFNALFLPAEFAEDTEDGSTRSIVAQLIK
jgi:hypothetical protein